MTTECMYNADWIVIRCCGKPLKDDNGDIAQFDTEAEAIQAAKERLQSSVDNEMWVYQLTQVIKRPEVPLIVTSAKPAAKVEAAPKPTAPKAA